MSPPLGAPKPRRRRRRRSWRSRPHARLQAGRAPSGLVRGVTSRSCCCRLLIPPRWLVVCELPLSADGDLAQSQDKPPNARPTWCSHVGADCCHANWPASAHSSPLRRLTVGSAPSSFVSLSLSLWLVERARRLSLCLAGVQLARSPMAKCRSGPVEWGSQGARRERASERESAGAARVTLGRRANCQ